MFFAGRKNISLTELVPIIKYIVLQGMFYMVNNPDGPIFPPSAEVFNKTITEKFKKPEYKEVQLSSKYIKQLSRLCVDLTDGIMKCPTLNKSFHEVLKPREVSYKNDEEVLNILKEYPLDKDLGAIIMMMLLSKDL